MNCAFAPPDTSPPAENRLPLARRLRYYAETAVFFFGIGFFRLFGVERASAIGGWIGRTVLAPTNLSRRARDNLSLALPEKTKAEIEALIRAMWDNLGRVGAEYAYLPLMHATGAAPRITISGLEHIDAALKRKKGIIPFSGHFGNWEIIAYAVRDSGISGGTIVRPTNNPYVNRWLERIRAENGMPEQIHKGIKGTKRVFTALRSGGAVCMMVDQRTSEGVPAPFFGHEAMSTPLPAAMALKLGVTLLPVSAERLPGARFHVRFHAPLETEETGDYQRDVLALTARLAGFIENEIRRRPEQWLWIHKRWGEKNAPLRKRAAALAAKAADNAQP